MHSLPITKYVNRKTFSILGMVRIWNKFPREVVITPSLDMFKVRLDRALSNLV